MPTTKADIVRWFLHGTQNGYSHMFVVCDTYDYTDAPNYFQGSPEEAREYYRAIHGVNMQKVMEVYNLRDPLSEQIDLYRCFNYGG